MDLNEAAVLVQVVQAGSFSAAARQLGLPTSTLSTRIARLEKRLGTTLLHRTTRRLALTEAGQMYYEQAALGLGYLHAAEAALDASRQHPQGRLRVTAPADLGDHVLAQLLSSMHTDAPEVQLDLWLTDRYVDLVAEGVDVAIRTGPLQDSSLMAKGLGRIQWQLFASPAYLRQAEQISTPTQLAAHRCVQFSPLSKLGWTLYQAGHTVHVPLKDQWMANSIGVVRALTEQGQGVALLPAYLCHAAVQSQRLEMVLPDWRGPSNPLHLVYPGQRFVPLKLRRFIAVAETVLAPLFATPE